MRTCRPSRLRMERALSFRFVLVVVVSVGASNFFCYLLYFVPGMRRQMMDPA